MIDFDFYLLIIPHGNRNISRISPRYNPHSARTFEQIPNPFTINGYIMPAVTVLIITVRRHCSNRDFIIPRTRVETSVCLASKQNRFRRTANTGLKFERANVFRILESSKVYSLELR